MTRTFFHSFLTKPIQKLTSIATIVFMNADGDDYYIDVIEGNRARPNLLLVLMLVFNGHGNKRAVLDSSYYSVTTEDLPCYEGILNVEAIAAYGNAIYVGRTRPPPEGPNQMIEVKDDCTTNNVK